MGDRLRTGMNQSSQKKYQEMFTTYKSLSFSKKNGPQLDPGILDIENFRIFCADKH